MHEGWKIKKGKSNRASPVLTLVCDDGREINVRYTKAGEVYGFPYQDDRLPHFRYRIHFSHGKLSVKMMFYGSYSDYEKGKNELTLDDLIFAVNCIMSDARIGTISYDEFCAEFGYDPERMTTYKIYKACKRTLNKLMKIGLTTSDIIDIENITNT